MKLTILGSSSAGNCYLLKSETETLIIEAGVKLRDIKLNVEWSRVVGALITHEHGDHAASEKGLRRLGVNVYMSPGTFNALNITKNIHRAKKMQAQIWYNIGEFRVYPFDVEHDAAQPFGFLINHHESGNILFVTDTHYIKYRFPDLNNLIIECNYSETILEKLVEAGKIPLVARNKLITRHMSLQTVKDFIKYNDTTAIINIVLIHLSDGNSNAATFKKEIKQLTRSKVSIADKGLNIDFNKKPF